MEALKTHIPDANLGNTSWLKDGYTFSATIATVRGGVGFTGQAMSEDLYSEPVKNAIVDFFSPKVKMSKEDMDAILGKR